MNMGRFSELLERLRITRLPKIKKVVFGGAAFISILLIIVIISNNGAAKKTPYTKVSILPTEAKPKKELDYEFIKFDTIKIPNFAPIERQVVEPPRKIEPVLFTENTSQPRTETGTIKKTATVKPTKTEPVTSEKPISFQPRSVNQNPNMIVTNNLSGGTVQSGGTPSTYTGRQSTLIKVVLPKRTPVANGSLVEARVLRDSRWGNLYIPRRARIMGIASLMNRRVNIDFQEIDISGNSQSCQGRAYDLKNLRGLPYSPVNSEAKRVLLEELRDAVSGVPVLGRVANRATYTANYYDQDVSVLDEGLEFYVLIESIY
jgi:hypothetical protein